jgi:nitrile hydratase accessory protein
MQPDAPDAIASALARDPGSGPVFAEPWQARAFAIAMLASRQGCFTSSEWSQALGRELRRAPQVGSGPPDAGYFECWLAALQALLIGKGAVEPGELRERRDAWEDAYRHTPHGRPVSLCAR